MVYVANWHCLLNQTKSPIAGAQMRYWLKHRNRLKQTKKISLCLIRNKACIFLFLCFLVSFYLNTSRVVPTSKGKNRTTVSSLVVPIATRGQCDKVATGKASALYVVYSLYAYDEMKYTP